MIFLLGYIMLFIGIMLAGMIGLLPLSYQFQVPFVMRIAMFIVGTMIAFIGYIIVHMRAIKTGTHHLIEPAKPGTINWLLVYPDGEIKVTPSMRDVEGMLYSKELDAEIQELKSYRWFDHSVRLVLEGSGHSADLGMALYTKFLKTKHGFENMREARKGSFKIFGYPKEKEVQSQEKVAPKYLEEKGYDLEEKGYGKTEGQAE